MTLDPVAVTCYRCERSVPDLAAFCEAILALTASDQQALQAVPTADLP